MRTDKEVRVELGEVKEEIAASLRKIESLKAAENPKAVLAERERLAELRRVGRGLLIELEQIGKSAGEVGHNGRNHR